MAGANTPEEPDNGSATEPSKSSSGGYRSGERIGDKYRLVRRLGEGGMASVWVAHNEALDIQVAIKFVRTDLAHEGLTSRLLQEARAAARLGHPAIVRVSDFGKTASGDPYIVMELLTGEDLAATIKRRGPMPPLRAVRTLLPIADALATAHAKRIVHRDLKPENIFLSEAEGRRCQPKLVDFGIAKLELEDAQRITQVGAAMGSPAYMSPEQARGFDVDARTDVWAFSVVLYEVVTGQLPFSGPNYTALVCSILEAQPKPLMHLGVAEPELWSIIAHGLEKDPNLRWASMQELGAALARWAMARGAPDDITGGALKSGWVERPNESSPPLASAPDASHTSTPMASLAAQAASSPGSTQLSATLARGGAGKGRSALWIGLGTFAVVLLVSGGLAIHFAMRLGQTEAGTAPAPMDSAKEAMPEALPQAPVEPEVAAPTQSAAEPEPSAAPIARTAVPRVRPKAAPKPAPKPAPSTKPSAKPQPELDIKTHL
jgi:eukaryotic-like serine/threonine-protein kinase